MQWHYIGDWEAPENSNTFYNAACIQELNAEEEIQPKGGKGDEELSFAIGWWAPCAASALHKSVAPNPIVCKFYLPLLTAILGF